MPYIAVGRMIRQNKAPNQVPEDSRRTGIELDAPAAWMHWGVWARSGRLILDRTHIRFEFLDGRRKFDIPRASIDSIRWSPFGVDYPMKKSAELELTTGRERYRLCLISEESHMGLFGEEGKKALAPWKAALSPELVPPTPEESETRP